MELITIDHSQSPYALTTEQMEHVINVAVHQEMRYTKALPSRSGNAFIFLKEGSYILMNVFPDFVKNLVQANENKVKLIQQKTELKQQPKSRSRVRSIFKR